MPTLPNPYAGVAKAEAPISGGRRATADDFSRGAFDARGVQTAAMSFLERTEQEEARKALVSSSEIRAKYARELDAAALSGADTSKLKEQMLDELNKVGENFQTKQGQESLALYTSNTELMYDEQANRIAVQRASAQARVDGHKMLVNDSAIIQSNPAYLPQAEKNVDALIATFDKIPSWERVRRADELKKDLNMAAAVAAARNNPEQAKKDLEAGQWNLTSKQRNIALNRATTEINSRRAEAAYLKAEARAERMERDEEARGKHFKAIMGGAPGVRKAIMEDADLREGTREHLIALMETRAKAAGAAERRSDPLVYRDLWTRARKGELLDSAEVIQAVNEGKLNLTDGNSLIGIVASNKDENGRSFAQKLYGRIQTMAGVLRTAPQYTAQPELQAAILNEITARVEKRSIEMRKEGKSPDALLDPDSKENFFTPGLLKSVADDVKARERATLIETLPKVASPADLTAKGLKEGDAFVAPDGQVARVTAKMLEAAKKAPPAPVKRPPEEPVRFPIKPSGGQ